MISIGRIPFERIAQMLQNIVTSFIVIIPLLSKMIVSRKEILVVLVVLLTSFLSKVEICSRNRLLCVWCCAVFISFFPWGKGYKLFQFPHQCFGWRGWGWEKKNWCIFFCIKSARSYLVCIERNNVLGIFYFEEAWRGKGYRALSKVNFSLVEEIFFHFVTKVMHCIMHCSIKRMVKFEQFFFF